MKTSIFYTALQASIIGLFVSRTLAQEPPSLTVAAGAIQTLACVSEPDPLTQHDTNTFQTSGSCQAACGNEGQAVMAITGGSTCYCGQLLPPEDQEVDKSKCDSPCQGYGDEMCGGLGYWQVYLTGLTGDVKHAPNSTTSSAAAPSSTAASATSAQATVIITASTSPAPAESSTSSSGDDGPNKIGIAVGVVVGVLAIAAIAGGAIFFMKQRRRKEIEEEHKAQAAVNSFVGSRGSDAKSDARLDPSVASSYRRESIGSIADERDFSRRILQVRNTDFSRSESC